MNHVIDTEISDDTYPFKVKQETDYKKGQNI